jgi:hypothetical protein
MKRVDKGNDVPFRIFLVVIGGWISIVLPHTKSNGVTRYTK